MGSPKLTLAMIVRDEAELLPGFLAAAKGLWDELVVVDTGSADATRELLAQEGARLFERPWDDDFAAARNFGLEQVRTEWVLFLDADEYVSVELVSQVRSLLGDDGAGAATVLLRNLLPHGHRRDARLLRCFRAHPSLRFAHAIHEDITQACLARLGVSGQRLVHLDGVVSHLGYVRARAASKDKKARDLVLLEKCLRADPKDFYAHFKRLELARFWSDAVLLKRAALETRRVLDGAPRDVLAKAHFGGELVALVAQGLFGHGPDALAWLDAWEPRLLASAAFFFFRGTLRERLARVDEARADFERCLGLKDTFGDAQLSTVRPLLSLARLELSCGEHTRAEALVEEALNHAPNDPESLLAGAVLAQKAGTEGLDAWRDRRVERGTQKTDLAWALGEEALLRGDAAAAVRELRVATQDGVRGPWGLRLAQAVLATGEAEAARVIAEGLLAEQPAAGLGLLVLNLSEGKDTCLELELEPSVAQPEMRRWVDALALGGGPRVARFAQLAGAVVHLFPWLREWRPARPAHLGAGAAPYDLHRGVSI